MMKYYTAQALERNKDELWQRIAGIVKLLADASIEWIGPDRERIGMVKASLSNVLARKYAAVKADLAEIFALLVVSNINAVAIFRASATDRTHTIAQKVVNQGALDLNEVCETFGWPSPHISRSYYYYRNSKEDGYDLFKTSAETASLSLLCRVIKGPKPNMKSPYSVEETLYLIPTPALVKAVYGSDLPKLSNVVPDTDCIFDGSDFIKNISSLRQILATDSINPGVNKIPKSSIKKLAAMLPLTPFPENYTPILTRETYVANMAFGNPYLQEVKKMDDTEFARKEIRIIGNYGPLGVSVLATTIKGISKDDERNLVSDYYGLYESVSNILKIVFKSDGWLEYDSLCRGVTVEYANRGCTPYILSYLSYYKWPTDPEGDFVEMAQFKARIHDTLLRAMVECLAAAGALELGIREGKISGVRLTPGGRWLLGMTEEKPIIEVNDDSSKPFEVDDATGIIVITNPSHPYAMLVQEFARKISSTRYVVTRESMIAKCSVKSDLIERIERFRSFILPEAGPHMEAMLKSLMDRCDMFKPVTKPSYKLFQLNPECDELMEFITNNPEIAEHSLRVEGCRLLVEYTYADIFKLKLAKAGFLI